MALTSRDVTATGLFVGDVSIGSLSTLGSFISNIPSTFLRSHEHKEDEKLHDIPEVDEKIEEEPSSKKNKLGKSLFAWCSCCGTQDSADHKATGTADLRRDQKKTDVKGSTFQRVASMNAPEWKYAVLGIVAAAVMGAVQPVYAYILSKSVNVLYNPGEASCMSEIFICRRVGETYRDLHRLLVIVETYELLLLLLSSSMMMMILVFATCSVTNHIFSLSFFYVLHVTGIS